MGKLVLGTVQFGLNYGVANDQGKPAFGSVKQMLDLAYEKGIDELDTADAYGESQEILRNYSDQSSVQFQIMSKFIDDGTNTFLGFFNNSLKRLNRQSLKGYYFHRFEDYKKFQNFKDVKDLKVQKKLELFGVSLYSISELREVVADSRIDLIQIPFNALDNNQEKRELLVEAHRLGKKVYIRSAFLQGVLLMPEDKIPAHLNPLKKDLQSLKKIAVNAGISMQELCLGYLNSKSFIDGILIGVDNVDQLKTNINLSKVRLPETVLNSIEQIVIQDQDLLNPAKWGK
jgi:aryl-alcohol dehydrogenase-like predicted oxidoreductase